MSVHRYWMYGIGVHSEIPLWGDGIADCPRDIGVLCREADTPERQTGLDGQLNDLDVIHLDWPSVCSLSVRAGAEIVVHRAKEAEPSHLRHLVSGVGIGLALSQQGIFTLHAGAVVVGGVAAVIAGHKGSGKSTLISALNARGHALLSDDVVAVDLVAEGQPTVRVGPPNVNLWPDSAIATGLNPSDLAQICSRSPKLVGTVRDVGRDSPVRLGAIIVLSGEVASTAPARLSPTEGFTQLVAHSYAFRWIERGLDLGTHMKQCGEILSRVPIFRLHRGETVDSVWDLAASVESLAAVSLDSGRQDGLARVDT